MTRRALFGILTAALTKILGERQQSAEAPSVTGVFFPSFEMSGDTQESEWRFWPLLVSGDDVDSPADGERNT